MATAKRKPVSVKAWALVATDGTPLKGGHGLWIEPSRQAARNLARASDGWRVIRVSVKEIRK